jgi:3-oxoacyl-[acyl-carrier protein] reductase
MQRYLVITGGSRGIGKATLALFHENGWKTINLSRTPCPLSYVINYPLDLSSSSHIETHAQALQDLIKQASILCLVQNAGYYKRDRIPSLSLEEMRLTMETNVLAPAALNKIFLPLMKPGSSIIYIGSTLSEKAVPGSASYVVSKHAVIGLMRATCQDLIGYDIHTCCICPGLVDTKILRDNMDEATINMLIETKVIAKRLIDPMEIAKVIHFCANSPVVNGTTLHANLGQVAD